MERKHLPPSGIAPAWLPNWKNHSLYPCHDSARLWAYEFLRRNEEYIADYEHFMSLPAYHEHGGKTGKFSGRSLGDELRFYHCDPPATQGEDFDAYCRRNGGWGDMEPLESYLMGKWGICMLPDPANPPNWLPDWFGGCGDYIDEMPPHILEFDKEEELTLQEQRSLNYIARGNRRISLLHSSSQSLVRDDVEEVFIMFDIRYPIERQIDAAKIYLIERHEEAKSTGLLQGIGATGPKRGKLLSYLRAFDAKWSGAKYKEIASILFPGKPCEYPQDAGFKQVNNALKQARRLVQGGYREMIRWA